MANILVIDDEENLAYSIQLAMQRTGHSCRIADTAEAGLAEAMRQLPDLAIVDIQLPDMNGLEMIARMKELGLDVPIIVITGFGTISSAVEAMKRGAVDYIQKPLSMEELTLAVDRCLENRRIRNQLDAYRQTQQRETGGIQVIAKCAKMREMLSLAHKIALVPTSNVGELVAVLILGETGTGKEAIARYIHRQSPNADRPFVQVNCTAIPESLFESELFGHEPGAFTSAKTAKKGLFEMADEGTLFLDEIGDMPLSTQSKLLIAIESGRFRRLGGTTERLAKVRVMAATNSDLAARVERGEFRADLYYRLKVFCMELPPLREREDDVFLLAEHFTHHYCRKFHKRPMSLSRGTRAVMKAYHWPGNVREMANVLQRAILVTDGDTLGPGELGIEPTGATAGVEENSSLHFDFDTRDCTLASVEKQLIRAALQRTDGNISETARLLGLTRGGLRHRIDKLKLSREREA